MTMRVVGNALSVCRNRAIHSFYLAGICVCANCVLIAYVIKPTIALYAELLLEPYFKYGH